MSVHAYTQFPACIKAKKQNWMRLLSRKSPLKSPSSFNSEKMFTQNCTFSFRKIPHHASMRWFAVLWPQTKLFSPAKLSWWFLRRNLCTLRTLLFSVLRSARTLLGHPHSLMTELMKYPAITLGSLLVWWASSQMILREKPSMHPLIQIP